MTGWKIPLCCLVLLALAGCARKTHYAWDGYDSKLYQHYKNPTESELFLRQLKEVIQDGEGDGAVPTGLYAEYGYALYEKGEFPEAARYFRLESDKWPESRQLMAKMMRNAQQGGKRNSRPPAGAAAPARGGNGDATGNVGVPK